MRHLFITLIFAVVTLLVSAPAMAQSDVERAQKFFDEGAAHYLEGDYSKALVQFRKAQAVLDNPIFRFNIALTEHKLGNTERALDAAESALATGQLDAPKTTVAQGLATGSGLVLNARQASADIERAATAVAQADVEPQANTGGDVSDATTDAKPTEPPAADGFGTLGWTGASLAAVGTGALAASLVIGLGLDDDYATYQDDTAPLDARLEAEDRLESRRPLGIGLLVGGSVLTALGATLLVIELTSGDESPQVSLTPTAHGGAVTIGGRF
jgi:tetratricopeptide (TPR) repeat protein